MQLIIERIFETIDKPIASSTSSASVQIDIEFLNLIKPIVNALTVSNHANVDIAQNKTQVDSECEKFSHTLRKRRIQAIQEFFHFQQKFNIRSILRQYYEKAQIDMSYRNLFRQIQGDRDFADLSHEKLKKWLIQLGFRLMIVPHEREIVVEAHHLKLARIRYLRDIQEYRKQQRVIIHFAELSIDCNRLNVREQKNGVHNGNDESAPHTDNHLTFFYAASKNGLINFAFVEKRDLTEVKQLNFTEWLMAVAVNLPSEAVIVLEHRPYSTPELPAIFSSLTMPTKRQIEHCLNNLSIPLEKEHTIQQFHRLWKNRTQLSDIESTEKPHFLDQSMESMGFNVLRLPDKHPELNPLHRIDFDDLVTRALNGDRSDENEGSRMQHLRDLVRDRLDGSTEDEWKTYFADCVAIENEFLRFEEFMDEKNEAPDDMTVDTGIIVQISDDED